LWRTAYAYREGRIFAELALRLVSSGTSESGAERTLSMAKHITGIHGTRYGLDTLRARLITLQARRILLHREGDLTEEERIQMDILDENSEEED
jgi:hypothetical protein